MRENSISIWSKEEKQSNIYFFEVQTDYSWTKFPFRKKNIWKTLWKISELFKLKGSYNATDSRLFWERKIDDDVNSDVSTDDIPLVYSVGDGWGQEEKGTSNENNFCDSESGYLGKWIKWKSNLWIKKGLSLHL